MEKKKIVTSREREFFKKCLMDYFTKEEDNEKRRKLRYLEEIIEMGIYINKNIDKLLDKNSRTSQVNACRYAQIVIRQNDFTDADLPW